MDICGHGPLQSPHIVRVSMLGLAFLRLRRFEGRGSALGGRGGAWTGNFQVYRSARERQRALAAASDRRTRQRRGKFAADFLSPRQLLPVHYACLRTT